jgi:hypothetical protein
MGPTVGATQGLTGVTGPKASLGVVSADGQGLPAKGCGPVVPGERLIFNVEPDGPRQSCYRVHRFSGVTVMNNTNDFGQSGWNIMVMLRGWGSVRLTPGKSATLALLPGKSFAPGVHCIVLRPDNSECSMPLVVS